MARRIDAALGEFLVSWVNGVRRRAACVIGIGLLVAAASLVYAAGHLGVNANSDELFDESLRFRQLHAQFDRAFPLLTDVALVALRSLRLILATLLTLAAGLACTAGFAALAIGHLNLISVAFAVLFIGLGVDFGIHFCLRYREAQTAGFDHPQALGRAARDVGSSLVLCAVTTAIGFYAFIPTGYAGVAELGLISGTGMFISLFASLTVLPAFVSVGLREQGRRPPREPEFALPSFPTRHPRFICTVALLLAIGALLVLPRLHFDANPLRVRDPALESVQTFDELVDEGEVSPWRIGILTQDLGEADALAARLRELGSVDRALTLSDSLPADQEAKLRILEDVSLFLGLPIRGELHHAPDLDEQIQSVARLRDALLRLQEGEDSIAAVESAAELVATLDGFLEEARHPHTGEDAVAALETSLVGAILERVERLELTLTASRVTLEQLPVVVRERLISADGRALVEVYPTGNLNSNTAPATRASHEPQAPPRPARSSGHPSPRAKLATASEKPSGLSVITEWPARATTAS